MFAAACAASIRLLAAVLLHAGNGESVVELAALPSFPAQVRWFGGEGAGVAWQVEPKPFLTLQARASIND